MTTPHSVQPLSAEQLSPQVDLQQVIDSLNAPLEDIAFIGQHRAQHALEFGLGMNFSGYNLYVMGEASLGRFTLIQQYLQAAAKARKTPDEWCYINNFEDDREPNLLRLNPGEGKRFAEDMESLIDELLDTFPAAFDNPGYQRKKKAIDRLFADKYDAALADVEEKALANDVALFEDNGVVSFAPVVNGKAIEDDDFAQLTDAQREHFVAVIGEIEQHLNEALIELPKWKRETSEQLRKLKRETIEQGIRPLLKDLEHRYTSHIGILKYLRDCRDEFVDVAMEILTDEPEQDKDREEFDKKSVFIDHFLPNVLVHYKPEEQAPVVYEPNPSFQNIFGRMEYSSLQGNVYTNYRMLRPGALHKANGGYLILDADRLLTHPHVWELLKQALKSRKISLEPPQSDSGMVNSMILNPTQVPLDVKIVLQGSRELYYLIQEADDEFGELFRVLAEFEHYVPATDKNIHFVVQRLRRHLQEMGDWQITPEAVVEVLRFGFRDAEHQSKLSARIADLFELLNEASFFARNNGHTIDACHVAEAMAAKRYRTGHLSESMLDEIREGHILIDTTGTAVGKVNGLTVLEIGDTTFGTPAKISATVYAGTSGITDIEREVELGKSIHSKGVLLLTGYLGSQYAQDFPLSLSANIAIEQSYGYIDGDSASLAEMVALVSAIAELPVQQCLAVTGSINQHGEVQAVGGVNEKIEGFFRLCHERGLDGKHGVLIPKSNVVNLVLNDEVLDAVAKGKFGIYPVAKVDEAIAILLAANAGEWIPSSGFEDGSVNHRVYQRLKQMADISNGAGEE